MKIDKILLGLSLVLICISCNEVPKSENHPVLKVSLKENPVSVSSLFKEIKLIPLETTEASLIRHLGKIEIDGDTVYVFDRMLYSLFIFGSDGRYINKIYRIGQGPGEYNMIYDFWLDRPNRMIHMLNPMGSVYKYRFDCTFIEKLNLPLPPPNYQCFAILNKNNYVTWSAVIGEEHPVNILDIHDGKIKHGFFSYSLLWNAYASHGSVFYRYGDEIYYGESMIPQVYRMTDKGYETAYEWDFGEEIIDPQRFIVTPDNFNQARQKLIDDISSGKVPFFLSNQFQSDKYYYTLLRYNYLKTTKNLFYDKSTHESYFFEKTTEGIRLNIRYMNEDYAIGVIPYEDKEPLRSVLSDTDVAMLDRMKEDDNPWLVKYTFRK